MAGLKHECPAGQDRQDDAPSPLYNPAAQSEHIASPSRLKVPLAQSDGSPDRLRQEYPAGQLVHSVEPLTEEYVPIPQAVQVVEPPREDVPAGHADGSCRMVKLWFDVGAVFVGDNQSTRFGIFCLTHFLLPACSELAASAQAKTSNRAVWVGQSGV